MLENENKITLIGAVKEVGEKYSYENRNGRMDNFYQIEVETKRLSDKTDTISVVIPEQLWQIMPSGILEDDLVKIDGTIRARMHVDKITQKSQLQVFVFATEVNHISADAYKYVENTNEAYLEGYVCRKPIHRLTKTGRLITELLIACNRKHNKSYYIPCLCWGTDAKAASMYQVGQLVALNGRLQSRDYNKYDEEGNKTTRTVHELSASSVSILDTEEEKEQK